MSRRVLVVGATPGEVGRVTGALGRPGELGAGPWRVRTGTLGGVTVGVVVSGVGKTNTGLALGCVLRAWPCAAVISVGVGGAYPGSGLAPGDLAVATGEVYGDEGAETGAGLRGLRALGLPLWTAGGEPRFEQFPVDRALALALAEAAPEGVPVASGPFVTVSTVTGTPGRARRLRRRYRAVCESMEGAAAAHGALAFGARFGEVRGISNPVGPRDRRRWRLAEAAGVAQDTLIRLLASGWAEEAVR